MALTARNSLALMLVGLCLSSPVNSYAQQSRSDHALSDSPFPIGELRCKRGGSMKTVHGTVVGDRYTVFTVAHFADEPNLKQGATLNGCTYRMFDKHGRTNFKSAVRIVSRPTVSQSWSAALDWAILRLDKPAPARPASFTSHLAGQDQGPTIMVRLQSVREKRFARIEQGCTISPVRPKSILLAHDCPSWSGTSGSPLLVATNEGFRVFAVQAKQGGLAVGLAGWPLRELRSAIRGGG